MTAAPARTTRSTASLRIPRNVEDQAAHTGAEALQASPGPATMAMCPPLVIVVVVDTSVPMALRTSSGLTVLDHAKAAVRARRAFTMRCALPRDAARHTCVWACHLHTSTAAAAVRATLTRHPRARSTLHRWSTL